MLSGTTEGQNRPTGTDLIVKNKCHRTGHCLTEIVLSGEKGMLIWGENSSGAANV